MRVELVSLQPPDESILFGLLPQPTQLPDVAVIGGSPGGLAEFSDLVSSISAGRLNFELLVPESSLTLVPIPSKQINYQNLDQINAQVTIIGPGLKLTSQSQILLDRWLMAGAHESILTDELLPLTKINRKLLQTSASHWVVSLANIVKIVGRAIPSDMQPTGGLQNLARLIDSLQIESDWLVCISPERVHVWLPSEAVLLHAPMPTGLKPSEIQHNLILAILLVIYRRRLSLDKASAWRVVLWLMQQVEVNRSANDQAQIILKSLQA